MNNYSSYDINFSPNIPNGIELKSWLQKYFEWGLCIIPLIHKDKKPAIEWKQFQNRKPTKEELESWFSSPKNVGVVCGKVSNNLVVLDFDSFEDYQRFFDKHDELKKITFVVKTSRGVHVYLFSTEPVRTVHIPELNLSVKGEKSYVVAPPSIHPSGVIYEPIGAYNIELITDFEDSIWRRAKSLGVIKPNIDLNKGAFNAPICIKDRQNVPPCLIYLLSHGSREGYRHNQCLRMASLAITRLRWPVDLTLNLLERWAEKCTPPFPKSEVNQIVRDVSRHDYRIGCQTLQTDPHVHEVCPMVEHRRWFM